MKRAAILGLIASLAMLSPIAAAAKDYYPDRALEAEVSGIVVIDCVLQPDGKVKDCSVVSETPPGYGFGEATVHLFQDQFDLNRQQVPGESHKPGDHMTFTYKWELN